MASKRLTKELKDIAKSECTTDLCGAGRAVTEHGKALRPFCPSVLGGCR